MDFKKLKPFVVDFIRYYYNELNNPSGGNLHVVLDDGNYDAETILFCLKSAEKENDSFGVFLAKLLLEFTEEELNEIDDNNDWWD